MGGADMSRVRRILSYRWRHPFPLLFLSPCCRFVCPMLLVCLSSCMRACFAVTLPQPWGCQVVLIAVGPHGTSHVATTLPICWQAAFRLGGATPTGRGCQQMF